MAAGAVLREGLSVVSVRHLDAQVEVELDGGEVLTADRFLLAGGAWSGQLAPLPVAPRKGQMIEVTLDGPTLPLVLRTPELYLVPRGDRRVAIGATVEHAGFDRSVDQDAGERLWREAAALWPPVLQGCITARWTGLRPGFREGVTDTLPVIGPFQPRIWAATAHFRNGILLAPGTARVLRQLLCGDAPAVALEAFSPKRFAQSQASAPSQEAFARS